MQKREFIKVGENRYMVVGSNNKIVSGDDILEMDAKNCPKEKNKKGCKDCEIKVDKEGILIDEKSVKTNDNK